MSYAAAKLTPESEEYLTLDQTRPKVPTTVFENTNYTGNMLGVLTQDKSVSVQDTTRNIVQTVNRIYAQIVRAIQDASFVPRINMAGLALDGVENWFESDDCIFTIDEDSEESRQTLTDARTIEENLRTVLAEHAMQRFETSNYLSTLTPEIVTQAIRFSLEQALKDIAGLDVEQTEKPVAPHSTLVARLWPEHFDVKTLPVMTQSAQEALNAILTQKGTEAVQSELHLLVETSLNRAHLSRESLAGCALSVFRNYPPVKGVKDQVQMSTLNPLDFMRQLESRPFSNMAMALGLDPRLRKDIELRIKDTPAAA